ncbi:MAG TPA: MFS transporter [Actinomycetota bacterium]|nr:MFS transporter [Actinomycetota bacterium]
MQTVGARTRFGRRGAPRLVTSTFMLVMLSTFAYFVSIGALIPTLPRFVKGPLDGSEVDVGFVVGSFALTAVLIRPFIGGVGDRRGRRVLMVAGGAIVAASVVGYVWASSLAVLVALRLVSGIGEAAFYVGAASVINDLAPDARRGEALSLFSLALYGGLAVGPVVGETVLGDGRFAATWIASAAAAALAAVVGTIVRETRPETELPAGRPQLIHPAGLLPGVVLACSVLGLAGYNTFVPLYALELGLDGSRVVLALYSAIVLGIRSFGARIPDRLGPARCARIALLASGAGLGVVAVWGDLPGLVAGTALFSVGQALTFPALMTVAVSSAPAGERGAVVGTFTAFFDLAFGAGAIALGGVAEALGYRGSFALAAVVSLLGVALMAVRASRRPAEEPAMDEAA